MIFIYNSSALANPSSLIKFYEPNKSKLMCICQREILKHTQIHLVGVIRHVQPKQESIFYKTNKFEIKCLLYKILKLRCSYD
jgi:hypothetical protein